jgi:transcriptional antiterminator NusG
MMAIDGKRLSEAKVIELDRAIAESDRQMVASRRQEALLAAAAMDGERHWAILRVASQRENDVDKSLCAALVDHWLPLRRADANEAGRRRGAPGKPLWMLAWPGYMFVRVIDTAAAWAGLAGVKHVKAVLGVGERPFFVSDEMMLRIKAELATLKDARKPGPVFVKGETVKVKEGPFAGFPGTIGEIVIGTHDERARIEVMIFGRVVPVDLELAQLAKG